MAFVKKFNINNNMNNRRFDNRKFNNREPFGFKNKKGKFRFKPRIKFIGALKYHHRVVALDLKYFKHLKKKFNLYNGKKKFGQLYRLNYNRKTMEGVLTFLA
jgi:hypothetical protein